MPISLKYTMLKDANIPLVNFRRERKVYRDKKVVALACMAAMAVVFPLFFVYALVSPTGHYIPWAIPQMSQSAFLREYALSPIPAPALQDYLSAN